MILTHVEFFCFFIIAFITLFPFTCLISLCLKMMYSKVTFNDDVKNGKIGTCGQRTSK